MKPLPVLIRRVTLCLAFPLLTSCASNAPISPKTSSLAVAETAEAVKTKLCADFKPERLTDAEAANALSLNYSARADEHWKKLCA